MISTQQKSILVSAIILLITSCETYLPKDFLEEDYSITDVDGLACEYLTSDLFQTDTIIVDSDTSVITDTLFASIYPELLTNLIDSTWDNQSDSSIINALFDSLSTQIDTLLSDTTTLLNLPENKDTSYAFYPLSKSGTIKEVTIYMNDFVAIQLVNREGKTFVEENVVMPLETISGCTEIVTVSGKNDAEPLIKTRSVFELNEPEFLIRFIRTDATENDVIRMVILEIR